MGLSDVATKESLESLISCWSDEDEMSTLERTVQRDYLMRMKLDFDGCPTFITKVGFQTDFSVT